MFSHIVVKTFIFNIMHRKQNYLDNAKMSFISNEQHFLYHNLINKAPVDIAAYIVCISKNYLQIRNEDK